MLKDHLTAHKASVMREIIEAAGAAFIYLLPYSPDFNPIECMWYNVKQLLRSAGARTLRAGRYRQQSNLRDDRF